MTNFQNKQADLIELIRSYGSCAVAFSAGVDSTVVAKAAALALGAKAVAVTGVSASLAEGELEQARQLADSIGIRHVEINTDEIAQADYAENSPDRCYHCKTALYRQMKGMLQELGVTTIVNGANLDDLDDYRPGNRAANEQQIESPLAACKFTKDDIRVLAKQWDLPIWDKPAMPCLSSRIAYGEQVTAERLAMVDRAERFLRQHGLVTVRVRYHRGDLARVEVSLPELQQLCNDPMRERFVSHLKELGFKFVTLDLAGFRSGSLNTLVPVELLERAQGS